MEENTYILDILSGLGLAINEKNNSEIVINYPINFDKKTMKFVIDSNYKITFQELGCFLADFLNTDFNEYNDFLNFFTKYSLSLLNYNRLRKVFKNEYCTEENFKDFVLDLQTKNKNLLNKLQEQTDMILDYCLLNPSKKAKEYKPIERFYVLRRISPNLTILNENKSAYYSINLFSSYPGTTEKDIYSFLHKKKNAVIEYDLILPYNISSILYKSICSILKQNVYLKSCKNCNKYFVGTNKAYNYCENIAPGETFKTCRDIGRKAAFENAKSSDPLLERYYKIYSRKSMMKSRNPDILKYVNDFNKFKEIGKRKVAQYKSGTLSLDDFKKWIEKNS
ncbi:MAG: hypothetical protein HFJ26_01575 [Clostridia bacterium]|nr:hypothetical protein [Clostridia bacterium]